jgi:anaerobic dimethyl sulfoxide reductase subunit B (iron-sulfur subunit)
MAYTFLFDSSYCTGCKACQAACKDKNQLPTGMLWRRVYEVNGGSWHKKDSAWTTDVYAYNISMACNHCEHPKCAGVCPTNAFSIRPDGIVLLDTQRCTGCGYCGWACPYGAPQFNDQAGVMTKCNFCVDYLETGRPPACVAACPMRTLDFADLPILAEVNPDYVQSVPPMPAPASRNPRFLIKPHPAVERIQPAGARIANREEVKTRLVGRFEEAPLLLFTLLAQMAVGAFWDVAGLFALLAKTPGNLSLSQNTIASLYSIGPVILLSLLISFQHLGSPRKAWRVLAHLRKSWLSREILFTSLFGGSWAISALLETYQADGHLLTLLWVVTSLCGLAAVWSMSRVYRLQTVKAWNSWRTPAAFFISTFLLGTLWAEMIRYFSTPIPTGYDPRAVGTGLITTAFFSLALLLALLPGSTKSQLAAKLRVVLIAIGILCSAGMYLFPGTFGGWMTIPLFVLAAIEETLGRSLFYKARDQEL